MNRALRDVFVSCLLLASLCGCVQIIGSSRYMAKTEKQPLEAVSEKATVVFVRPTGQAYMHNFQVWDGETFAGVSQSLSYFRYVCDPGKHLFLALGLNKSLMSADLDAGKVYFVITEPRMGFGRPFVDFIPVKQNSKQMKKTESWMSKLQYNVPVEANIKELQEAKKAEIADRITHYNNLSPEQKAEFAVLQAEDGVIPANSTETPK